MKYSAAKGNTRAAEKKFKQNSADTGSTEGKFGKLEIMDKVFVQVREMGFDQQSL